MEFLFITGIEFTVKFILVFLGYGIFISQARLALHWHTANPHTKKRRGEGTANISAKMCSQL